MPTIREYRSTSEIRPSDKGTQEWEVVGRRAGPLYAAAGQDVRERARLTAADIEGQDWPLMFLTAYRRMREDQEDARGAAFEAAYPAVGVRFRGGGGRFPGMSSGTAGGRIGMDSYAAIVAGANSLSYLAANEVEGGRKPIAGKIVETPTFRDDLQRELAQEPWAFDRMIEGLTGAPPLSYDAMRSRRDAYDDIERGIVEEEFQRSLAGSDQITGHPAYEQAGAYSPYPDPWSPREGSRWWNPLTWSPSSWFRSEPAATAEIPDVRIP